VKSFEIHPRLPELELAASDRIEHPGRDGDDVAGLDFDVDKCARRTRLTVVAT
jgi:hypothetical protein